MNDTLPLLFASAFALSAVLLAYVIWSMSQRLLRHYRDVVLGDAHFHLTEMFIFLERTLLVKISLTASIILPLLSLILTGNPLFTAATAVACLFGPNIVQARMRANRLKKLVRQLPDTLDSLVGALRSGMSLPQALGLLAEQLPEPSCQEFSLLVRKLRMGVAIDEALEELETRIPTSEYTMFTTSMRIAREVGGNLTESLERLADTMRKKLAMEDKILALTSQGKMQGLIVGCLPLFLMWVLKVMEPEAMAPLFNTWMGYGVLLVVFLLELVGFILIRKIVTIDV